MAKLFQAEKQKMADLDNAELLQKSKKQSSSPTGYFFTTLYLGSKNTRMAPKTHTTYVRISTQRMDTLHTIRWGRGFNQKSMWKKFLHSTKFKCTCVRFDFTIPRTPFLNRLFCIEIFIFETSNHP